MSGRQGIITKVSGSLIYDDDSSSSSDDEVYTSPSPAIVILGKGVLDEHDDDEELEVFANFETSRPQPEKSSGGSNPDADVSNNSTPQMPPSVTEETMSRKLVDLMAASVEKHSGDKIGASTSAITALNAARENASQSINKTKVTSLPSPKSSAEVVSASVKVDDDSEAFGIIYKPYKKSDCDTRYAIPDGADDDKDLRVDVASKLGSLGNKSSSSKADDNDDDDFDIDGTSISQESSIKITQLVNKAVARDQDEERAILASLASEMGQDAEGSAQPQEVGEDLVSNLDSSAVREALGEAVAEGYDSITNMYRPGAAGDTDVRAELSSGSLKNKDKGTKVPDRNQADIKTAIIEEEEAEAEEDEDEDDGDNQPKQGAGDGSSTIISVEKRMELNSLNNAIEEFDASIPVSSDTVPNSSGDALVKGIRFVAATYSDTLAYVQGLDLNTHESPINPFEPRKATGKSIMTMMGLKADNRKVDKLTVSEEGWTTDDLLRWPFLLAQRDYNPSEPRQLLILQSIYRALIGKHGTDPERDVRIPPYVPATGGHWEAIGFQGNDPCTDINRSMKLFALLQALHYVLKHGREAKQAHYLSSLVPEHKDNDTGRDLSWPFMCVSISFTKEAVVALRTGELNGICNDMNSVLEVLYAYHRACFDKFCSLLCDDPMTHHAIHLSTIRAACADKPAKFLRAYLDATPTFKRQPASSISKSESLGFLSGTDSDFEFADVEQSKESANGVDEAAAASYLSSNSKAKKFLAS